MTYQFDGERENQSQGTPKDPLFTPAIGENPTKSYTYGESVSFKSPEDEQLGASLRFSNMLWTRDQSGDTVPAVEDKPGTVKNDGSSSHISDRARTVPSAFPPTPQLFRQDGSAEDLPIPVLFKPTKPANDLEIVGTLDPTDTSAKKKTGEVKSGSPTDLSIVDKGKKTGAATQTEVPTTSQPDASSKKLPPTEAPVDPSVKKPADGPTDVKLATQMPTVHTVSEVPATKTTTAPVVTEVPTTKTTTAPVVTEVPTTKTTTAPVVTEVPVTATNATLAAPVVPIVAEAPTTKTAPTVSRDALITPTPTVLPPAEVHLTKPPTPTPTVLPPAEVQLTKPPTPTPTVLPPVEVPKTSTQSPTVPVIADAITKMIAPAVTEPTSVEAPAVKHTSAPLVVATESLALKPPKTVSNDPALEPTSTVHTDGVGKVLTKSAPPSIDHVPTEVPLNTVKVKSSSPSNEPPATVDNTVALNKGVLTKSTPVTDLPDATTTATKTTIGKPDASLVQFDASSKVKSVGADLLTSLGQSDSGVKVSSKSLVPPVIPPVIEPTATTTQVGLPAGQTKVIPRTVDSVLSVPDTSLVSHVVAKPTLARAESDAPTIEVNKNGKPLADLAGALVPSDITRTALNKLTPAPTAVDAVAPVVAKTRSAGGDMDPPPTLHDAPPTVTKTRSAHSGLPESVSLTQTDGLINRIKLPSDPTPVDNTSTKSVPGRNVTDITGFDGLLPQAKPARTTNVDTVDATSLTRVDGPVFKPPATVKVTSDFTAKVLPADVTPPTILPPARAVNLISNTFDPTNLDSKRHTASEPFLNLKPADPVITTTAAVLKKSLSETQMFEAASQVAATLDANNKKNIVSSPFEQAGRSFGRSIPQGDVEPAGTKHVVRTDVTSSVPELRKLMDQSGSDTRPGASPINITKWGKSDVEPSFTPPEITRTVGVPPAKTDFRNLPADLVASGVNVAPTKGIVPDTVPYFNPVSVVAMDTFKQLAKPGQESLLLREQQSPSPRIEAVLPTPGQPGPTNWFAQQVTSEVKKVVNSDGDYSRPLGPKYSTSTVSDLLELKPPDKSFRADSHTLTQIETMTDGSVKKALLSIKEQQDIDSRVAVGKSFDLPSANKTSLNTPPESYDTSVLRPSIVHARSGNDLRPVDIKDLTGKPFTQAGREVGAIGLSGLNMNSRPVNADALRPQIETLVNNQELKDKINITRTVEENATRTNFFQNDSSLIKQQLLADIARTNPAQLDKFGKLVSSTSAEQITAALPASMRAGQISDVLGRGPNVIPSDGVTPIPGKIPTGGHAVDVTNPGIGGKIPPSQLVDASNPGAGRLPGLPAGDGPNRIPGVQNDLGVAGGRTPDGKVLTGGSQAGFGPSDSLVRTVAGPDGRPVQVDASGRPVPTGGATMAPGTFGPNQDSRIASGDRGVIPPAWTNAKLTSTDRIQAAPGGADQGKPRNPNGGPAGSPVVRAGNVPGASGGTVPAAVVRDGGTPRIGPNGLVTAPGRGDSAVKADPVTTFEQSTQRILHLTGDGRTFGDLTVQGFKHSEVGLTGRLTASNHIGFDISGNRIESGLTGRSDVGTTSKNGAIDPVSRGDAVAKGLGIVGGAPGTSAIGGDHLTGRREPIILTGREVQVTSFDPQGRAITTTKFIDQSGRVIEGARDPQVRVTGMTIGPRIPGEIDVAHGSVAGVGRYIPLSGNIRVSDWQPIREPGQVGQLAGDAGRAPGMRGFQLNGDVRTIAGRTEIRAPHGETHRYITGLELALILSIAGIAKLRGDSRAAARLEGRVWSIGRQNGKPVIFVDGRNNPFQIQRGFGRGDAALSGKSFRIMVALGDSQSRLSTRSMRTGDLSNGLQSDGKVRPLNMSLLGRYHYLNYFGKSGPMNNYYGQFRSTSYTGGMGLAFVMAATGMTRGPVDGIAGPADRINITQAQNASSGRIADGKVAGNKRKGADENQEEEQSESALDDYEDFIARLQGFAKRKGDDTDDESVSMRKPVVIGTRNLYDLADEEDEVLEEDEPEEDDTVDNGILSKVLRRPKWVLEVGQTLDGIAERLFSNPDVGWLIADLNRSLARETYMDGKRIVEFSSRQEIELPVHQDIQKFTQSKKKGCNAENLVTIVIERHVEREAVESVLSKVIGAEA